MFGSIFLKTEEKTPILIYWTKKKMFVISLLTLMCPKTDTNGHVML